MAFLGRDRGPRGGEVERPGPARRRRRQEEEADLTWAKEIAPVASGAIGIGGTRAAAAEEGKLTPAEEGGGGGGGGGQGPVGPPAAPRRPIVLSQAGTFSLPGAGKAAALRSPGYPRGRIGPPERPWSGAVRGGREKRLPEEIGSYGTATSSEAAAMGLTDEEYARLLASRVYGGF